ncbi:hypothetical protein [Vibrio phage vB_VmeM-Yong XC32]|nr:hypothetical protein [Vibrio phage vB_VmeM-Yong XC31]QAX96338.1 hypothetical protein [Vibrio phage vB_VmeM-Yong XC32]QAX96656.1 hypothetical protein [Vibrio phage vB_VmeM-Yong MS31]QAX96974.1 hypothetical protein [Vibrio phage vB_VmeM-Yong MS32]
MFVLYETSKDSRTEDLLIVKERLRNPETGAEKPSLRLVRNYKRQFAITKKALRTHKQKKEWEFKENCDFYECTSAELPFRIAKALNKHGRHYRLGDLCESPYVYGADISSSVLYKHHADVANAKKNGAWNPDMSMAVMDFETDMLNGTEYIISGAVSFGDKALIAVTEEFIEGCTTAEQIEEEVNKLARHYIKKDMEERNIKLKVTVCKNDFEVCARLMQFCHALKPDFLVFWNAGFDIKKMIDSCKRHRVDPANIFCDPAIPPEFRKFNFRESKSNKVMASGKKLNFSAADLWHVIECPASFYIIDAMSVFKMLRVVEGMRRSYSLDAILEEELGFRKLEYEAEEASGNHNVSWHRAMQRTHKLIYLVYNLFDCVSVELLDKKTGDLAKKIALYADGSEFSTLKSNPKRLANALHFYLDDQDKVICTTSTNMTEEEFDHLVIGKKDWIVTLANELTHKHGADIWKPEHRGDLLSRIATHVYDIDITSGYPSGQWALNVSRGTTLAEICKIVGQLESELRRFAVNMTCVQANAIDMGHQMLGLPNVGQALAEYAKDNELAANDPILEEVIRRAA